MEKWIKWLWHRHGATVCIQVMLLIVLFACAETVSSSEKHISISHGHGTEGVKAAYEMADKHCRQFGKVAVPSVSGRRVTTFRCE